MLSLFNTSIKKCSDEEIINKQKRLQYHVEDSTSYAHQDGIELGT
jgi:hypothetical protein